MAIKQDKITFKKDVFGKNASSMPDFEDHGNQTQKNTTCYMCACRCGIKVTLENNKIRYIQGEPTHPVNKGVLCAKGNAGIMKQISPARLRQPMMRKPGAERGTSEFIPISWEDALDILTERLQKIRNTDPKKLAFFTGRDQMQALTGFWAQQFGTINWAAHGGFCSVNMAAAGLYTTGFSFWEFGDPDWDKTKYFMLWGVAEDHASNPMKMGINKLKERGGKFVAINPVRTGYQAVADEWVPIKPGTDAMLALSLVHVLLKNELFDWEFLVRYTNAHYLVVDTPREKGDGLFYRNKQDIPQSWDLDKNKLVNATDAKIKPALLGKYKAPDGTPLKTVFTIMTERYMSDEYTPENASKICGVPAEQIEKIALELAHVAFKESIEVETEWTDWTGRKHDKFIGRPVSMHAMRGISAHSNGFQACRAIHFLQVLLGSVDCPGGHLAKPPYPKHVAPPTKPGKNIVPGQPLESLPLGFPSEPEDLAIDAQGNPLRIDKAYSWEAPIANHGLMHMAITNAVAGDPYEIDTMIFFMANMAWNSTMNTSKIRELLCSKKEDGEYKIPFLVVCDAFDSETVGYADLVLPDTTYLERYDTISVLDRPISEPHAICDSIRAPILEPDRDVRPWQTVLVELASRLKFPEFTTEEGNRKFKDYKDFIINYEREPGIGFLAGWRGENGENSLVGKPNSNQWEKYIENKCFFEYKLADNQKYFRGANKDYLEFANKTGFIESTDPIIIELYSEKLQKFKLAGMGLYDGPQPKKERDQFRLSRFFDPIPEYYIPLEHRCTFSQAYPFYAITQRPMFMYHSWDSQNAWLRQLQAHNYMHMNKEKGEELGIKDLSWVWVESNTGKIKVQVKLMEGCQKDTLWTWNAIGKQKGKWGLSEDANESTKGFLMNHLINEHLPCADTGNPVTNSDPITGQAAWYDLKVNIYPAGDDEQFGVYPNFKADAKLPGSPESPDVLRYNTKKPVRLSRSIFDILTKGGFEK